MPRIPRVVKRAPLIAGRVAQSTAARSAMDPAATVVIVKPVSATRMPSVVMPSGMISACPSAPRTAEVVETSSVGMVHASRVKPAMCPEIAESAPAFAETGLARSRKIAIPARGIAECASWTGGNGVCDPGEDCVNCTSDCGECNTGCYVSDEPGCDGCACEACVCEQDPFCCNASWDDLCTSLCDDCGGNCPSPPTGCEELPGPDAEGAPVRHASANWIRFAVMQAGMESVQGNARIRVVRIAAPPSLHSVGMEPAEKRNPAEPVLRLRNLPQRQHSGDSPDSGGPGLSLYGNGLGPFVTGLIMRRVPMRFWSIRESSPSTSTQTRQSPRPPLCLRGTHSGGHGGIGGVCGLWFRRRIRTELRGRYHANPSGLARTRVFHTAPGAPPVSVSLLRKPEQKSIWLMNSTWGPRRIRKWQEPIPSSSVPGETPSSTLPDPRRFTNQLLRGAGRARCRCCVAEQ